MGEWDKAAQDYKFPAQAISEILLLIEKEM
jgi:hypothetical protein